MRSDVAVVGAGPAGAWAAHVLARRGARVTLIDPSHPREKPCGGGVTGRALALIEDALDTAYLPRTRIRGARFIETRSHGGTSAEGVSVALDGGSLVVASRRLCA